MYPPRVAARVAWEWAWLTGVNNWSKLTGIIGYLAGRIKLVGGPDAARRP